jgi:glycosyltransferase involved in cell wall biosynthesis
MKTTNQRIGIDVSTLINHGPDIGAGRYIINLVRNLIASDKKNTYVLTGRYISDDYLDILYDLKKQSAGGVELKLFKTSQKKLDLWDRFRFPPLEFRGFKADILHCPDYLIPPTTNKNLVITVHDLSFIRYPQFNFEWFIKKYTREVRKSILLAKKIIADSESTKNDIIKFFGIDPKKVFVIYLASDSIFRRLTDKEKDLNIIKKYGIDKKYILSVGTIEPRKDFVTLIRAFNHIKQTDAASGYKLVIAGRTGWKSEPTYAERESSPFREDILFTGRVPDSDLNQIYNQAEIFVYPSIFEGFGLPPLEAMSCGLPVVARDTSSIKEVVGESGILLKDADEKEFGKEILNLIKNDDIKEKLKFKSLARAKVFGWDETAKKTIDLYYRVT